MQVTHQPPHPPTHPPPLLSSLFIIPNRRLCECTEAEAEIVLQLKNELREKELKLTDIRLEALSSAHHLDQIREAMNRMQVRSRHPIRPSLGYTRSEIPEMFDRL